MKTILIVTDFSKDSKHTIDYVIDYFCAVQAACKIILLNTYLVKETDPILAIAVNDELKEKSKRGLESERDEILKKVTNAHITVETVSFMGSVANVIFYLLKKENINLVAIAKDEGKDVEAINYVLKNQNCPLLTTF